MQLGPQEILPGYELSPSQSELMALDITQQIAMVTRLHPKGVDFNIFGHIYKGPINQLYTFTAYTIRLLCLDNEYSQNHYLYSLPADKVLFPNIDLLFSKY